MAITAFGKIKESFKAVTIGALLFAISFFVLYWNEGRVDFSNIAETATEIQAEELNQDESLDQELVSATGTFITNEKIGDDMFLNNDKYVAFKRKVEMYAWAEEKEEIDTNSNTSFGTNYEYSDGEYYYNYELEWTENPIDSSEFQYELEHQNPLMSIESSSKKAQTAQVGIYEIDVGNVDLPEFTPLPLNKDNTTLYQGAVLASTAYLFQGNGDINNPQVGDLRISYEVITSDQKVTIFGKLKGKEIVAFIDNDNNTLYRIFKGTNESALETMHSEYTTALWGFRIVGFLMMWFGLMLILGPISAFFHLIPVIGGLFNQMSKTIINVVTLVFALALSFFVVIVSILIHNILTVLIVLGILAVIIGVAIFVKKKGDAENTTPTKPADPATPAKPAKPTASK